MATTNDPNNATPMRDLETTTKNIHNQSPISVVILREALKALKGHFMVTNRASAMS